MQVHAEEKRLAFKEGLNEELVIKHAGVGDADRDLYTWSGVLQSSQGRIGDDVYSL